MTETSLQGVGVLVTRPRAQAAELIAAIEAHGGEALSFPVIDIVPRDDAAIGEDAARLGSPDITVFISGNAVTHGSEFAGGGSIAAVGPATAAALERQGKTVHIRPDAGFSSESLLAEPALQNVAGKTIRIIRGGAGRELLATTLSERAATVEYLSVYDRELPSVSPDSLRMLEDTWRLGRVQVVTAMSVETLKNLLTLLPEWCRKRLENVTLVTPSARVLKEALNYSPTMRPFLASGPQSGQMLDAIIASQTDDSRSGT